VYPDSGSLVSPPEVEMLVGGKRKRGSKASRRKNKRRQKTATKNYKVDGGARVVHTPLGNGEVRRECLKRVALEEMKSRVRKLPHPNPEVDEYKDFLFVSEKARSGR